ncbi:MAG: hypothetical protein HW378_3501 [Anaerolineales bacterium]|nr:hypothetical protein [Anaerolineales bacterium]
MGRSVDQLKRKLRQLKRLEVSIRFKDRPMVEGRKLLVVVLFVEEDWLFEYYSEFDKLVGKSRRPIQAKSPELSAVAFCSDQLLPDATNPRFIVFRVAQKRMGWRWPMSTIHSCCPCWDCLPTQAFRTYHPDHGGDNAKFIELVEIYEQLKGE